MLNYQNATERFVKTSNPYHEADFSSQLLKNQQRSHFAKDLARVLHSGALRRLSDKTQVVSPRWNTLNTTPRTRLTHSLEVSQIGKEIGVSLGLNPDIVELACLSHDIGHPPFGHNGEKALASITAEIGGFESNAQNLRILTRLEPKVIDNQGISRGLNLTRLALDATIKYPWLRSEGEKKFGVYEADLEIFNWIRKYSPLNKLALEAQVMNWADDVAYSVHDIEDGTISGLIDLKILTAPHSCEDLAELAKQNNYITDNEEFISAAKRLSNLPAVRASFGYLGDLSTSVKLKQLTSYLVSRFTNAVIVATTNQKNFIDSNTEFKSYQVDLVIPSEIKAEVNVLKTLALPFMIKNPVHLAHMRIQREIIFSVVELLKSSAPNNLEPWYAQQWKLAKSDTDKLRVIIDQVSIMTETRLMSIVS